MAFLCCVPNTKSRTEIKKHQQNDRLEFLIVLTPSDFTSRWYRRSVCENVMKLADELQGKLHIGTINNDMCMCCQETYNVYGILRPHMLYVKLPKEGTYVRTDIWEHEYIKSQVHELMYIFRKLEARTLHVIVNKADQLEDSAGGSVDLGLSAYGIDASIGGKISNTTKSMDRIETYITFESDTSDSSSNGSENVRSSSDSSTDLSGIGIFYPSMHATQKEFYTSVNDFVKDNTIHYLHKHHDWMNMLRERLDGNASMIKFQFSHQNVLYMSRKFITKMDNMGISVHYDSRSNLWVRLDFSATF
jgi:hypothetical protein